MAITREIVTTLLASAAGAGALAYASTWVSALARRAAAAEGALAAVQAALQHEQDKRQMERRGRTNAEKQLRYLKMQLAAVHATAAARGVSLADGAAAAADDDAERGSGAASECASDLGGGDGGGDASAAAAAQQRADGSSSSNTDHGPAQQPQPQPQQQQQPGLGDGLSAAARMVAGVRGSHPPIAMFPLRPIGYLQTCFSTRNGTPRQPLLVPSARAVLRLAPYVSPDALQGLEQYSHVWVLYIFHANTDLPKVIANTTSGRGVADPAPTAFKAKIRVPRLDGAKMGVLATRSPHRPAPIGLSVAKVVGVEGNRLILGGADIVDGSPVLDIKPYVPFCDAVAGASAPAWVSAEAADEPLKLPRVVVPPAVEAQAARVWRAQRARSVYPNPAGALGLIREVLARDIRSLNQRLRIHPVGAKQQQQQKGGGGGAADAASESSASVGTAAVASEAEAESAAAAAAAAAGGEPSANGGVGSGSGGDGDGEPGRGRYVVVLDGMDVTYDLEPDGTVLLRGVYPLGGGVEGGEAIAEAAAAEAASLQRAAGVPTPEAVPV